MNRLKILMFFLFLGVFVVWGGERVRADEYSCSGTGWCRRADGASTPFDCNKSRGAQDCASFGQDQCNIKGSGPWTYDGGCTQAAYCMPIGGQVDQGCAVNGCPVETRRICTCQAAGNYSCVCNSDASCPQPPVPTNTPPPGCVPGSCNTSGCSTTACGQPCGSNGCTTCSTGTSGCTGDNLPKGYHDVPTNADCQLHGWTCDPDRYSQALLVDFWQGGTYVGQDTAHDFSEDGVNAACGNTPNHRFSYTLPLAYQDGNPHTITAFGIGINSSGGLVGGSGNTPLTNSTQTITCAPAPTPCLVPANPTGLSPSSNQACGTTSQTFSWNAVAGASSYYLRIDDKSDPWYTAGNDTLLDAYSGTSYTRSVVPGRSYGWWVHAANSCGLSSGVGVDITVPICPTATPVPPTPTPTPSLSVAATCSPTSGVAPLNNVDITGNVSGTATGSIRWRMDCTNDTVYEHDVTNSTDPYTAVDLCDYSPSGLKTVLVRADRSGLSAYATCTVNVSAPTPTPTPIPTCNVSTVTAPATMTIGGACTCWTVSAVPSSGAVGSATLLAG